MFRDNLNKRILLLLLFIFTFSFLININSSEASPFPIWETETLEPNSAAVYNLRSCTTGMTIEVQYNVVSGPGGVDAYLVEGVHTGLIITKPSSYLRYEDNSISDSWVYEVLYDNDYCVQFFNDHNEDIRLRYLVQTSRSKILGAIYLTLIIGGIAAGAIVTILLVTRRKKKRKAKALESESKTNT
jgi:hypothetical protein